jgi:hypothetical protein
LVVAFLDATGPLLTRRFEVGGQLIGLVGGRAHQLDGFFIRIRLALAEMSGIRVRGRQIRTEPPHTCHSAGRPWSCPDPSLWERILLPSRLRAASASNRATVRSLRVGNRNPPRAGRGQRAKLRGRACPRAPRTVRIPFGCSARTSSPPSEPMREHQERAPLPDPNRGYFFWVPRGVHADPTTSITGSASPLFISMPDAQQSHPVVVDHGVRFTGTPEEWNRLTALGVLRSASSVGSDRCTGEFTLEAALSVLTAEQHKHFSRFCEHMDALQDPAKEVSQIIWEACDRVEQEFGVGIRCSAEQSTSTALEALCREHLPN